jgi:hypothetical protein
VRLGAKVDMHMLSGSTFGDRIRVDGEIFTLR